MKTSDKQIWKQSFISTIVGFVGCSIGSMSAILFLSNETRFFVLLISIGCGFLSGLFLLLLYHLFIRSIGLTEALKSSYGSSILSILIIVLSINLVFIAAPDYLPDQANNNLTYGLILLCVGMGLAFIMMMVFTFWQLKQNAKQVNQHLH